jgi:hypothetical protein
MARQLVPQALDRPELPRRLVAALGWPVVPPAVLLPRILCAKSVPYAFPRHRPAPGSPAAALGHLLLRRNSGQQSSGRPARLFRTCSARGRNTAAN